MTSLLRTTALTRRQGVLAQQLKADEGSVVLLNPKNGEYYTLEAVACRIWQLCDGVRTIADIAIALSDEYSESPEVIEVDIIDLAKELVDEGLVVPAG